MSKILRNYIFGHHRRNPLAAAVARRAEKIVLAHKNFNYNLHSNGEEYFLRDVLAPKSPKIIFDVGANDGSWAILAAQYCKDSVVHGFEIVPATADICAQNIAGHSHIILNRTGLSDAPGTISVRTYDGHHTHASILDYPHDLPSRVVECPVMRGDDYVAQKNITQIDLLKIDVEGAENRVIAGFSETLRQGKIAMIQFEYGRANILSKYLLRDWYGLLTPLGYKIGKLYPNFIDYKDYELVDEDFIGPNFVAMRSV